MIKVCTIPITHLKLSQGGTLHPISKATDAHRENPASNAYFHGDKTSWKLNDSWSSGSNRNIWFFLFIATMCQMFWGPKNQWRSLAGHLFAKLARWKSCSPQSVVVLAARRFNWNWKQLMVCQSSSSTSSCALYGSSTAKSTRKPCKGRCFIPPKTWRNEELKDSESCSAIQMLGKLFCLCAELLYTRLTDSHKI